MVTPLLSDNELDCNGLEKLIEHVIAGGVHGIFILGTTGEAQSISLSLREQMIQETSRILKGRLPLLVGISDTNIGDSVHLANVACDSGADAVVSAAPYYYATGQPELAEFYERLIHMLPLPIFLYNMPSHTKVNFSPAVVQRLAQNEKVIGFKDSSANATYLHTILYTMRHNERFSVLVGPEEMTAAMLLMGADGGVNGGANVFPELYVNMYNAAVSHDFEKLSQIQDKIMAISTQLYTIGQYGSSYLKGVKSALALKGICNGYLASPYNSFDNTYLARVQKVLDTLQCE